MSDAQTERRRATQRRRYVTGYAGEIVSEETDFINRRTVRSV
jgi:hypothetical protein